MSDLVVGSRLESAAEFDRLPVGTVIGPDRGQSYTKDEFGWRYDGTGDITNVGDFNMNGHNKILSLPSGKVAYESLVQWQWRFRDNAYASAEQAGVGRDVVEPVLRQLGIGDDVFPLGAGVVVTNEYDKGRLDTGTVGYWGNPEQVDRFGLFVKKARDWELLLGNHGYSYQLPVTVITGDPPEWARTPGTEGEQQVIADFKAKAWRAGWRVKKNHRWCETYEHYMARVGLDHTALDHASHHGLRQGDKVSAHDARILPAGSVLRWTSSIDPNLWAWFIRDDGMSNTAATRRLFGNLPSARNYRSSMEILWLAVEDEPMELSVDLAPIIEHVPPGTRLEASGSTYVIAGDHGVAVWDGSTPRRSTWQLSALGEYRVVGFPS